MDPLARLLEVVRRTWGFAALRPLQQDAMQAVLAGRDSLVVLPTGGGKSLCYQAPALVQGGTTVVVSPLIALMKDQVDGLRAHGVPAVQLDSSLSGQERFAYEMDVRQGAVRLLFMSPERLVQPGCIALLRDAGVRTFAIDEAHCISHWGHDFRPEYRQLGRLREFFPGASVHAYTATATEQVREDICRQLDLRDPLVLVGDFDRPNLTYRVVPRATDIQGQILEVLERHRGEAGILYCLRRKDVDEIAAWLQGQGMSAVPYHAGLDPERRRAAQEAFVEEKCDLVVATIAFGMGIDRSNVRFVLHVSLPKSIEHYQQEAGRAGRDGLEAECILLHSGADQAKWKFIFEKSAAEHDSPPEVVRAALAHVREMDAFCRKPVCRHRALVEHFGQKYAKEQCGACDVCLGGLEPVPGALDIARKILSCVARVEQRFGRAHVVAVLRGSRSEKILALGHDQLSTHGLLKQHRPAELHGFIDQLVDQDVLVVDDGEYPILKLNPASWEVMKAQRQVRLLRSPVARPEVQEPVRPAASPRAGEDWEGVDRGLFDELRQVRRQLADRRGLPPYLVFNDVTLREMARHRPADPTTLRALHGVGDNKLKEFGRDFLQAIAAYCRDHGLPLSAAGPQAKAPPVSSPAPEKKNTAREQAFAMFRAGDPVEEVMHVLGRSRSTVVDYLCEFLRREGADDTAPWLSPDLLDQVRQAVAQVGSERLKPIFETLGGKVSYDEIRVAVACLEARPG